MNSAMLEYQKIELQISKIKKATSSSDSRKIMEEMAKNAKILEKQYEAMNVEAEKQLKAFNDLNKIFANTQKKVDAIDFSKDDESILEDADKLSKSLSDISKKMQMVKNNFEIINKQVEDIVTKLGQVKIKFKKAKIEQDTVVKSAEQQILKLENDLKEVLPNVDKNILARYQKIKEADNVMPVFVPIINGDCCGGCTQKLAMNKLEQFKTAGELVCEHCRRVIYS